MKPEQAIQRSITDWLSIKKIWWMRMNSGAVISEYQGKKRMFRFGTSGCADLLISFRREWEDRNPLFVWIEVKAKTKQSDSQKEFQKEVERGGHYYLVAYSIDDVENFLAQL